MAAGILVGLLAAIVVALITRSFKLRLWEAGRLAGRLARGDYGARLSVGPDDEVGWLEDQLNQMAMQLDDAVKSLRDLAEQNRLLGEEAGRGAALEERMRLARDLHDTVNQQLFVLAMRTAAIKRRLEKIESMDQTVIGEIETLETMARQTHSQIRELILELRPVTLEQTGLGAALLDYSRGVADREGWQLETSINLDLKPGQKVGENFFRIAQEALNNAGKHAAAKKITLTLACEDRRLVMTVGDDGAGFDLKKAVRPTSIGLSGIKERALAIGGEVKIDSVPGKGTTITITAPLMVEGDEN